MVRKRVRSSADEDHISATPSPASEARTTETEVVIAPQSLSPTRPLLTLLTGVNAGEIFTIERGVTVIGRSREAWVRIDAVGVSRRHAKLIRQGPTTFRVEDLGSTNGVYVNGERVETKELANGDQLQIGSEVVLRFSLVDAAQEQLARKLYESSTKDALTGAFNRKYLATRLDAEVAYAGRHHVRLGLLMLDLDHFKTVNDEHGHVAGDAVLRAIGQAVAQLLRMEDVFARYGGEEFVVLVRGITAENVRRLAERIRKAAEALRVPWEFGELRVTLSAGLGMLDECPGGTAAELVALADQRLYRAKNEGRNRIVSA
jgi:diguanylate cyclase (GGDEF)-like protein